MSDERRGPESEATLYDPPVENAESMSPEGSEKELELEIPQELATRLLEVSMHLGLSPSMVASRAIGMVCNEIGLVEDHEITSDTLIQKYQTRLDLLHQLDYDVGEEDEEEGINWDAVDEIIRRGEG